MRLIFPIPVLVAMFLITVSGFTTIRAGSTCDLARADTCIDKFQKHVDALSGSVSSLDLKNTEEIGSLCAKALTGTNFTKCYIDSTSGCDEVVDRRFVTEWSPVQNQLFQLCEKSCPGFVSRSLNITKCSRGIQGNAQLSFDSNLFCSSMDETLVCAWRHADRCAIFPLLVDNIFPPGSRATARSACNGGCGDPEAVLDKLAGCQRHMENLLKTLDCSSIGHFKECVEQSGISECAILKSVVSATYPRHIYGPLENHCNVTSDSLPTRSDTECQEVMPDGFTRLQKCMRDLLISASQYRAVTGSFQRDGCIELKMAMECVAKSGALKCSLLRQFYHQMQEEHREYFNLLRSKCSSVKDPGDNNVEFSLRISGTGFCKTRDENLCRIAKPLTI